MRKRTLGAALAVALTTAATSLVTYSSADASVAQGYIAGGGVVTDDWGDEGTLSRTSHSRSNAVMLWQIVLWADGKFSGPSDCIFGPATEAATKNWQRAHGLTADGIVGPQTFAKADNYLVDEGVDSEDIHRVTYRGTVYSMRFARRYQGYYQHPTKQIYFSYTSFDSSYCG